MIDDIKLYPKWIVLCGDNIVMLNSVGNIIFDQFDKWILFYDKKGNLVGKFNPQTIYGYFPNNSNLEIHSKKH